MFTSDINFTSTIKLTSIDVSLWLEVWQEMWGAGEGERPTMELKNYKRWSQNINIFNRLFNLRRVSYLWQGMNREGKRRWWSAFAVEVKRRWNPEEKTQTWSTPSREQNVIVFSIYTRKWDCHYKDNQGENDNRDNCTIHMGLGKYMKEAIVPWK